MGAAFDYERIKAKSMAEAVAKARDAIEQAKYDYGHAGYSGTLAESPGVDVRKETFVTFEEAQDFARKNHHKWERAFLIETKKDYFFGGWMSG
jgi:hypothetical protein